MTTETTLERLAVVTIAENPELQRCMECTNTEGKGVLQFAVYSMSRNGPYRKSYKYFFRMSSKISYYHKIVGLDGPRSHPGRARNIISSKAVHTGSVAHSAS